MWTPAWFDMLFMLLTSPATWVIVGIVLALMVAWVLRAAWRVLKSWASRG